MKVAPQFRKYLESNYINLEVDPDSIDLDSHAPDSSHSTRMELEELEGIIEESKLPPNIMRIADKAPLKLFYAIAKKKGLDSLEEEVKEWAEDWTKLSFDLKFKFKRRRPYEVKKEHDIDFVVDKSDTSESPSYPSGHAMMAYGVAEFYKEKYPLMAEEWDNVADIIAHSRLQSGVHYPSDVEASKKVVDQVTDLVKEASRSRAALRFARQRLNSGKGITVHTSAGTRTIGGPKRYKLKSNKQQTTTPASPPEVAKPIGFFRGAGQAIKNNPGKTAIGVGGTGVVGYKVSEDLSKQAALPSLNTILKATESGLAKLKLPKLADKVDLYRARRNLGRAVKDLTKYQDLTGRLGQMPRMVIPKTHLDIPDLYRLGFQDSLIAVPELGQKNWTSYRHPLTNVHLHDHGKFLNMHVDSLPSLQMIAERNSLTAKARRKLMATIPQGVEAWMPKSIRKSQIGQGIHDQVTGIGHAILEGVPGYLNYGVKSLNPRSVGMAEEIISKLPKNYLEKRYGITKVSSEQNKLAAPKINQQLLKKIISGSNRGGFLTSGSGYDNTPPLEADPNYTGIVPPKPKRKRQELEEIVSLVRDEIAKASPEDMAYSKLVASGLPMEEIVARELVDPFTSRDNWTLTPEEYKQFRYSVIKDKKKLYPVARPFELAKRYGLDLGLPEDVAQRNAREHPAFANFSYPSFHTARGTFLAETARDLVPEDQQQLVDDLISRIGRSRIQQGVHSHQDVEAGEAMGREAAKIYKELGIKTAQDQPLLRHRSTLLIRDPETNKLLAAKETDPSSKASPFFFPGGGLYDDEYSTPRNPSDEDIIEGARREALEELGIELDNPRVVGSYGQELEDWWKEKSLKNRGVPYLGGHEHYVLADRGKEDRSLYNLEGDAFDQGDYYDPTEIVEALSRVAKGDSTFAPFNREQVRAIKDNLLKKNASDLSVLTAVPTQNLDMIMQKGLYSQKAMLDDPEVMAAFLAQRNADKAWKNDEQYDEKRFREQYDKRLELMGGRDAPLAGPSVFFTEPDPDKVSDPRHLINKFNTQTLRVNLAKLLKDIPETRIQGAELTPFLPEHHTISDEEWEEVLKQRERDLSSEEVVKYVSADPKELWKHYPETAIGKQYAANVPHAFIRTPSGIIPPEYLEQVEKTSEEKLKSAVIIKGNPYYVNKDSENNYENYYKQVEGILREAGYGDVSYDPGEDYTAPKDADLWVGHSRGGGRLRLAPENTKTLRLDDYEDGAEEYKQLLHQAMREGGYGSVREFPVEERPQPGKGHWTVTDRMREALLKTASSAKEQLKHILKKKAGLEDEFQPDLTPDALKSLGVYDQVYGDEPSEASMKEWPEHWINKQDPLGWLQWYDRYSGGRRTDDDDRQMKRWKSFKARHLAQYLKKPTPRRAAALRNWGVDVRKY